MKGSVDCWPEPAGLAGWDDTIAHALLERSPGSQRGKARWPRQTTHLWMRRTQPSMDLMQGSVSRVSAVNHEQRIANSVHCSRWLVQLLREEMMRVALI